MHLKCLSEQNFASRLSIREMYRNLCENCTENVKPMGETGSISPLTAYFEA